MMRATDVVIALRERLTNKHLLWWLVTALALVALFFLVKSVQPTNMAPYQQLVILYAVDSLLFFFTDRTNPKMGALALIFLVTMEVIVATFYLISLAGGL